ncbi:MAG: ATP-binding protein [Sphaerochaetaceae bacterium]|nr:ATP-binding protein [Sphaerochaetaceae bacterium]
MVRNITIYGYISKGYTGQGVQIQCSIRNGFPGFDITGLPGSCIKEARERIRCALRSCRFKFPQSRVLINLSPASQPKDGTLLDLALACSILVAQRTTSDPTLDFFDEEDIDNFKVMVAGELDLEGELQKAPQTIGAIDVAKALGCKLCLLPLESHMDDAGISVIPVRHLKEAFTILEDILDGKTSLSDIKPEEKAKRTIFEDVIGLDEEKEILAMAVSGFHSTLLFGPPGVGKTMLSQRLHLLLSEPDEIQTKEMLRIQGCAEPGALTGERMRLLGHDCTQTQFLSGPSARLPGEGALAHCSTLVLDEIERFTPKLLQTVKDTYDAGMTQSSRSGELLSYPARFLMVANMNPCSCGALGDPDSICTCTAQKIDSHWRKVGRQLIERFDVRLPLRPIGNLVEMAAKERKSDAYYLEKVRNSTQRQRARYKYIEIVNNNGHVHFSNSALFLLRPEMEFLSRLPGHENLSSRSQISLVSLARTIADYEDCATVTEEHFAKAEELRRYGLGDYYWRTIV